MQENGAMIWVEIDRIGIWIVLVAAKEPSRKDGIIDEAYDTEGEAPTGTDWSVAKKAAPFSTGSILIQAYLYVMEIILC